MPIILDGYTFPEGEQPYHGPLELLDEQKWTSAPVLGSSSIGTILTFESLRSQKIPMSVRASTATRDKLLDVYTAQKEVLLQTNEDTTGFNVLVTDLEIGHEIPLPNSLYLCEFVLRSRRAVTGTPTPIGNAPSPTPGPGPGPIPEDDVAVIIIKNADEIVNDSSAFQDDNELVLPIGANEKWFVVTALSIHIKQASDFKFRYTRPVGAVDSMWITGIPSTGGTTATRHIGDLASSFAGFGVTVTVDGVMGVICNMVIINGANAGDYQLQWAQNVAVAEDTSVKLGSSIVAWRQ